MNKEMIGMRLLEEGFQFGDCGVFVHVWCLFWGRACGKLESGLEGVLEGCLEVEVEGWSVGIGVGASGLLYH